MSSINTITLEPLDAGNYVVAVSGGVDSVVLLHLLRQMPGIRLTVAHFDHGIRQDSAKDRRHVAKVAHELGLPFVSAEGRLGSATNEAEARRARYQFLHKVRQAAGARAVVTGHHQDDVLETAILNLVRGTGRKGLTSLRSTELVKRPLLHVPKADIRKFAAMEGLVWHEDSTNTDMKYLRNHIRHNVVAGMSPEARAKLQALIQQLQSTNQEIDELLHEHLEIHHEPRRLNRHTFVMLPHSISREVMAAWLRANGLREFDTITLERLVQAAKVQPPGKRADIGGSMTLYINKDTLALGPSER